VILSDFGADTFNRASLLTLMTSKITFPIARMDAPPPPPPAPTPITSSVVPSTVSIGRNTAAEAAVEKENAAYTNALEAQATGILDFASEINPVFIWAGVGVVVLGAGIFAWRRSRKAAAPATVAGYRRRRKSRR